MINEEGGIDPEQFRMEAMFDRMDAIGKGVLGLTIQCAQCHNHKFDPLTQDEYYRMFAFLNNSPRGEHRGLHARRADEAGRHVSRQIHEIEAELAAPQSRLAQERWHAWEETVRNEPAGVDGRCGPRSTNISTGGQKYLPHGGRLVPRARATRRPSTRVKMTRDDRRQEHHRVSPGAAQRSEPAAGRAGPVDQGDRRADGVQGRGRAGGRAGQKGDTSSSSRRRPTSNPPETPLASIFDDKSGKKRVTGPGRVRHRRQGRDRPGASTSAPAAAISRARPSSSPRNRSRFPKGTILTFHLKQNHGGWNSDDNQNNNLGRFRLVVNDSAGRRGRSAAGQRARHL